MQKIDIPQILADTAVDKKEIANLLFPNLDYPILALNRIVRGEGVLDADQISRLASYLQVDINSLFSGNWRQESKQNTHTFKRGDFIAELNTLTWVTKIYHNSSLFHESILHSGSTPLSEYFSKLDQEIQKYAKHEINVKSS